MKNPKKPTKAEHDAQEIAKVIAAAMIELRFTDTQWRRVIAAIEHG